MVVPILNRGSILHATAMHSRTSDIADGAWGIDKRRGIGCRRGRSPGFRGLWWRVVQLGEPWRGRFAGRLRDDWPRRIGGILGFRKGLLLLDWREILLTSFGELIDERGVVLNGGHVCGGREEREGASLEERGVPGETKSRQSVNFIESQR